MAWQDEVSKPGVEIQMVHCLDVLQPISNACSCAEGSKSHLRDHKFHAITDTTVQTQACQPTGLHMCKLYSLTCSTAQRTCDCAAQVASASLTFLMPCSLSSMCGA